MNLKLTKRKRRIVLSLSIILIFTIVVMAMIWSQEPDDTYVRDEAQMDGITSRLSRDLPADIPEIQFKDVTESAGIRFQHFYGERGSRIAEDMGSGLAWIDYNNNGWQDLLLVNYAGPLHLDEVELQESPATLTLYKNNGDGTFTDVSEEAGLNLTIRGMGVACADINNNGWIDCLVTGYGRNYLLRNNGNGTFTDISGEVGIAQFEGFWAGAAWGDFNLDGFVDLYITGYLDYFEISGLENMAHLHEPPSINPSVFEPVRNLLFRNNGDGTFTEIAEQAGVDNPDGRSLTATWIDLTYNGLPDLYVANDVSDNMLYRNLGDGTFINIGYSAKVADYRGSMGMALGDWDGDEDFDIFITHWIAEESALYNSLWSDDSEGMIFFRDDADHLGLGQSSLKYVGWATSFMDIDNDGRPDLFVVNGHTNQNRDDPKKLIGMNDQIYWNRSNDNGFYDISSVAGSYFSQTHVGRGGAYADYNNNGLLDLFILNHNGPGVLLENQTKTDNNWFQVHLTGVESNRSAIGAKLRLVTTEGVQINQVGSQSSYLSQNSLIQHFGLGNATRIDSLEIEWPGGNHDTFINPEFNQRIHITEGDSKILP